MKTAEEWARESKCDKHRHGECECFDRMGSELQGSCDQFAETIRSAQRDAIEAAIDALPANVASNTEWIASFDIGIDACRDAIRSLLPKEP